MSASSVYGALAFTALRRTRPMTSANLNYRQALFLTITKELLLLNVVTRVFYALCLYILNLRLVISASASNSASYLC